jgi:hypothetical protein
MIRLVRENRSGFHRLAQKAARFAPLPLVHDISTRHTLSIGLPGFDRHRGLPQALQTAVKKRQDADTSMTHNPAGWGDKTHLSPSPRPQTNRWNILLAGVIVAATVAAVVILMQFR